VLLNVGPCLRRIPLIDHSFSLPQRAASTSYLLVGTAQGVFGVANDWGITRRPAFGRSGACPR
jgi:hypothetical protein